MGVGRGIFSISLRHLYPANYSVSSVHFMLVTEGSHCSPSHPSFFSTPFHSSHRHGNLLVSVSIPISWNSHRSKGCNRSPVRQNVRSVPLASRHASQSYPPITGMPVNHSHQSQACQSIIATNHRVSDGSFTDGKRTVRLGKQGIMGMPCGKR